MTNILLGLLLKNKMPIILIYATFENLEQAKKIANHLLEKKLIACVNFIHIENFYWWNEKIENANEILAILKTRQENWEKVKSEIKKLHSYDIPCIIKIDVEANKEYKEWIIQETE